ncbi:GNAT family N-acetyltransferase [Pseudoalteromonas lipolytica]|uniref:GNAT family N-acetyltransferase n=1 Tax=Pseudoalteromonas lipolytica TaxID=570156 RepID=UPI003B9E7893
MLDLRFKPINSRNVEDVCALHRAAYLDDHFSSKFNDQLLSKYYLHLSDLNDGLCFISYSGTQAVGFVIAGKSLNNKVKEFVRLNRIAICFVILRNPSFIIPKIKSLFTRFSKSKWKSTADLRVLSIAVSPQFQGEGVGKSLLAHLESELKHLDTKLYGLSVKKSNIGAQEFYEKRGFIYEAGDKNSLYYVKELI